MEVGENGALPETVVKKRNNLPLKIILCFLVIVVIGLVIAIIVLHFGHEQVAKKCDYKDLGEVDDAISKTLKMSEGEELDALENLVKECEGREYEYDFRIARALEFNHFDYYELAKKELDLVDEDNITPRQTYNYYHARAIVYDALGDEENTIKYRNLASELYLELYGEGGVSGEVQE